MYRLATIIFSIVLLSLQCTTSQADDQTHEPSVTDAEIIQFILDRNNFHKERDLNLILKYFPKVGVIMIDRTLGDKAEEIVQKSEEVATQTKKVWDRFTPKEMDSFMSGTALRNVTRKEKSVILRCSYMDLVPIEDRHLLAKGVMDFTLVKVDKKVTMTRKELIASNSTWITIKNNNP